MAELVDEYGYNSSGETITVCDPNEAWIMEIIGKGPNRKGAVWVALRIPDDCICAHANLSRIRQFPQEQKKSYKSISSKNLQNINRPEVECVYAYDVISFARELGFFSGNDADFSFRDAYCPIDFENVRYADARVWSFFRHHYKNPYLGQNLNFCLNLFFTFVNHYKQNIYDRPDNQLQ